MRRRCRSPRALDDETSVAEVLDDLADVYLLAGDIEIAVKHYSAGLKKARSLDRPALTADILMGLARCNRSMGKLDSVRDLLDEAKEEIESIDASELTTARLTLELAQLDEDDGRLDTAIENYEDALAAFKRTNDVTNALVCNRLLLRAYARQSDLAGAGRHLSELLGRDEQDLGTLWTALLERLDPRIAQAAKPQFARGRYPAAVREAFKACEDKLRRQVEAETTDQTSDVAKRWFTADARGIEPWASEKELRGFLQMWLGAFEAARNPLVHHSLPLNATDAFAWLAVTHLLHSWLEMPDGGVPEDDRALDDL